MADVVTERELNRALLARQGLLERLAGPVERVVGSVGALQMQHWPALVPAVFSRMTGTPPAAAYQAHARGELLTGTLLRGTIHTVPAAQFPAYAAVAAASKPARWWRGSAAPGQAAEQLRRDLWEHAAQPRDPAELGEFVEAWLARHPGALADEEIAKQRPYRWRPLVTSVGMVRVPADGRWSAQTPRHLRTAPVPNLPDLDAALDEVVTSHLRGFGPAAAEDVAWWIGWPITPVRAALRRLPGLVTLAHQAGRTLYDLADAARPPADTAAQVRLLAPYDSVLMAYAPKFRTRILPVAHRDAVFIKANGQIKASVLVDGLVAGTWSVTTARSQATLTITPLARLTRQARSAALAEAEQMVACCQPDAQTHRVAFADS